MEKIDELPPGVLRPVLRAEEEPRPHSWPNLHFDIDLYRLRHLVENFFCRIKRHRAVATRYDKLARNYLAIVYIAAVLEALK